MTEMIVLCILAALVVWVVSAVSIASRSRRSLVAFTFVGCFVPYWVGIEIGTATVIPIVACMSLSFSLIALTWIKRILAVDFAVFGLAAFTAILAVSGVSLFEHTTPIWLSVLCPYILGRGIRSALGTRPISNVFAVLGAILAVGGIFTFLSDFNPLVNILPNFGSGPLWSLVQYRAGMPRTELALGHSIVYGNVLALTLPFVFTTRWRTKYKIILTILLMIAIGTSFSRNAAIAGILSFSLIVLVMQAARWSLVQRLVIVFAISALSSTAYLKLVESGSFASDFANSTDYRLSYVSILGAIRWIGLASDIYIPDVGGRYGWMSDAYAGRSIATLDSTPILWGLEFGWVVTIVLMMILLMVTMRGRWSEKDAAALAVIGQLPTIATVAMITQYPYMLWLVIGMAATSSGLSPSSSAAVDEGRDHKAVAN